MLYYDLSEETKISKIATPTENAIAVQNTDGELVDTGLLYTKLVELDANNLIPTVYLPPLSISSVAAVADIAARDALTVEMGDVAIAADHDGNGNPASYIYDGSGWLLMQAPNAVLSVNTATGIVVLTTADINASLTPTSYTAADATIESHLVGIESALQSLQNDLVPGTEQSANFTATIGNLELVNVVATSVTVTAPAAPVEGDRFAVVDSRAKSATNSILIDFVSTGINLHGSVDDYEINSDGGVVEFRYINVLIGWIASK